jgi:aldehyde:ferredoxin oxidoreductase
MFEPAKEGFRAEKVIPFEELMEDYYLLRGWNEKGEPKSETLARLDLVRWSLIQSF